MLWAIDVGNTHTVVGRHDGSSWHAVWRLETGRGTEDELAATLAPLCGMAGLEFRGEGMVIASVVPTAEESWRRLAEEWLRVPYRFLRTGSQVGLEVTYDPPHAVGADRIANALAAIAAYGTPVIVVDFGTATTFDTIDAEGRYLGGAIMPGIQLSVDALSRHTAKLPTIALRAPERAIGRTTVAALESGVVLGYAGGVEAVASRIKGELGGSARVIATGGLGSVFHGLCPVIEAYDANLTLEGLRLAWPLLMAHS